MVKKIIGKPIMGGIANGKAMVTGMPVNFTASFSKPGNFIPAWTSKIYDHHHDLYKKNIRDRVLIFPTAIGSTYTGMMLLDIIQKGAGPAAMIVQEADSLLVSGSVLASVWYEQTVPIVETDLSRIYRLIKNGTCLCINGDSGEISISD